MTGPPGPYPPPPPQPYSSQRPGQPPAPERRTNWWAIAAVVFGILGGILIIGVAVYLAMDRGGVDVADVGVGECVAEVPDSSRVSTLHTVDCAEPHRGEVVALIELPAGDYPGRPFLEDQLRQCGPAAARDRAVELFVLAPSEESWDRGHRAVTCIAITDTHRTGTLR